MAESGRQMNDVEIQIAIENLRGRMSTVELGVSNFRQFQQDMRDSVDEIKEFIVGHEVRDQEKEKVDRRRSKIHFALLTALITLVIGCAVALFSWVLNGHHTVVDSSMPSAHISQDAGMPSQP